MRYITDEKDPELLGVIENDDDINEIKGMVERLNVDLRDCGFDQYQYFLERRGTKAYIRQKES